MEERGQEAEIWAGFEEVVGGEWTELRGSERSAPDFTHWSPQEVG